MAKLTIRYLEIDLLVVDGQIERFNVNMDQPKVTAARDVIGAPRPKLELGHRVGAEARAPRPPRPRKRKPVRK